MSALDEKKLEQNQKDPGKKKTGRSGSRRLVIQSIAALIQNANLKGFFTGKIYTGTTKKVCVPGLNCYSCPGAVGACPIGSLQNFLGGLKFRFPYYVLGLLIFFGALLGRVVCGFLCPFGLLQDLLFMIPFYKKNRFKVDRFLRYLKYVVLLVLVIILPLCIPLTPTYCKYLCPSGTTAGLFLSFANSSLRRRLGKLFAWKAVVLGIVVVSSLIVYRPFCKYLCPLGAFYGFFNRFAIFRMHFDAEKCVHCQACVKVCKMNVDPTKHPNSMECIRCGDCVRACPQSALEQGFGKGHSGKTKKEMSQNHTAE